MPRRTILCLAAVVLSLAFAPAPFPRERHRNDPTAVTGTWQFVRWEVSGLSTQATYTVEMSRDKFDFVAISGPARTHYEMRLFPDKTPHAFEWRMNGLARYVGSYRLKGDEMTMIFASGSQLERRPTDFSARTPYRFVLRRMKR